MLTAHPTADRNVAEVTQGVLKSLQQLELPPGYSIRAGGELEAQQESFGGIGTAVLVAVFGILAVLVLEFGSFRSMLIVAGVIPLGMAGGFVALFLTGYDLSFTATIGVVALIGIEIKNSILLVDFTNQLREQGVPLDDAITQAGEIRFLPILLTSATAIGGLLPLALQGSGLYSPLAIVIIGGLISSTLLGRLVTPVMYKLLPPSIVVVPMAKVDVSLARREARSDQGWCLVTIDQSASGAPPHLLHARHHSLALVTHHFLNRSPASSPSRSIVEQHPRPLRARGSSRARRA